MKIKLLNILYFNRKQKFTHQQYYVKNSYNIQKENCMNIYIYKYYKNEDCVTNLIVYNEKIMIQLNLMNMDFNTKYKEFKTAVEIVFQTSNFEVW